MNFELSSEQRMIIRVAGEIAREFPPEYWREKEEKGEFAYEFWNRLVETGIVSMVLPEEYGGVEMGLLDLVLVMEELCAGGCGLGVLGISYLQRCLVAYQFVDMALMSKKRSIYQRSRRGWNFVWH